eukprot:TRINITY_DN8197_c0_g1_i2.p1 TRINITY_DN8197_c0_g1~~TRINITY_DN8197_c0_g1_i2.p1  ORF type:complete len:215 (+),score=11.43 TRINITY_DN8197_c0_g1_i2:82-726(+)
MEGAAGNGTGLPPYHRHGHGAEGITVLLAASLGIAAWLAVLAAVVVCGRRQLRAQVDLPPDLRAVAPPSEKRPGMEAVIDMGELSHGAFFPARGVHDDERTWPVLPCSTADGVPVKALRTETTSVLDYSCQFSSLPIAPNRGASGRGRGGSRAPSPATPTALWGTGSCARTSSSSPAPPSRRSSSPLSMPPFPLLSRAANERGTGSRPLELLSM